MQFHGAHGAHAHGTRVSSSCGPRNVYLDLGANMGNNLATLYEPRSHPAYGLSGAFDRFFGREPRERQRSEES